MPLVPLQYPFLRYPTSSFLSQQNHNAEPSHVLGRVLSPKAGARVRAYNHKLAASIYIDETSGYDSPKLSDERYQKRLRFASRAVEAPTIGELWKHKATVAALRYG